MSLSEDAILDFLKQQKSARREEIRRGLDPGASETTVWRHLKVLLAARKIEVEGRGPATRYRLAGATSIRAHLSTPWNQRPVVFYKKSFLDAYIPNKTFYLNTLERRALQEIGAQSGPAMEAGTYAKRILERLLVDLSWASSRMEGNTYNILDTERLIRFGEEAAGKERKEAVMILNHKDAIQYVVENIADITLSRQELFNLHALLSTGLLINPAMAGRLREMAVDIAHSSYKPLDNKREIEDEFEVLVYKAAEIQNPFEQSFFLLMHIPFLQPFDDVNKRTGRVAANIPLLKAGLAPLSFVAMNDRDYIDGLLGVYELNNIALLRDAYIAAYRASADNYKTLRAEVASPEKAALSYRDFVKSAIRRCVLEWKACAPNSVLRLAQEAGIPENDRQAVIAYVLAEFAGLHEGNCIRYRLKPQDLEKLKG
jgi:Fic family protein